LEEFMSTGASVALSEVAQAVFSGLLELGEATRKTLAEAAGLSFPTVTVALGELASKAMVCELRREQGARGRATIVYGVNDAAGWVLGVDIGSTQVSFIARALSGKILDQGSLSREGTTVLAGDLAGDLVLKARGLKVLKSPPVAVALALNQVVPRRLRRADQQVPLALDIAERFIAASDLSATIPFLVENNVNCAAVAEHQDGLMRGHDDAAYMQIGVGVGLGFFADGALIRGGQGASGELAQIPISWDAEIPSPVDAIEKRFGSSGLMQRAHAIFAHAAHRPSSPEELFAMADRGDPEARSLMLEHGVALGRIAAAAATILDPSVIVLGGGLTRSQAFSQIIIEEFRARNRDTDIEISQKGSEATLLGAWLLGRDLAMAQLAGRHHRPILLRPTLVE
jgi:predicted NBD/HSP70 family sugar kinase